MYASMTNDKRRRRTESVAAIEFIPGADENGLVGRIFRGMDMNIADARQCNIP